MKTGKKNTLILCSIVLVIGIVALVWLFKPNTTQQHTTKITSNTTHTSVPLQQSTATANLDTAAQPALPTLAPSLQGTDIDCPLQVDSLNQLILNVGIRSCFDYFFSSIGEKTEVQLIADIEQYITTTLPAPAAARATQLLKQYVGYIHALRTLQPAQQASGLTAESYKKIVDGMQRLQRQFFSLAEIDALFGNETAFNQLNIEKLKIDADKTLSPSQKAAKIAAFINQLPDTLADSIRPSMQFAELQQLTHEIKANGGSAAELRAMRENLVGAAAADRLEQVDRDASHWQSKVDGYLASRDQIKHSGLDDSSKQQAITRLRERHFTVPEERLRVQTFEMMHDAHNK